MDKQKRNKIANNILEFLFDPTLVPIERRMYFRPEEILKNQSYEQARAESNKTYGDQRQNSDFYPPKNKMSNESEASSMDRKTLIASMDILSQTFQENDPIGKDLRSMAFVVAKMSDEELASRLVESKGLPPWLMKDDKGKVVKNPDYKKKADEEPVAEDTKEASEKTPEVDMDTWTKEASEAVKKALIADVIGDKDAGCKPADDGEDNEEDVDAKKKAETDEKEASEDPAQDDEVEKEAGKDKGPGGHIPDGTGPHGRGGGPGDGKGKDSPECLVNKDEKEDKKKAEETKEAGKDNPGVPDGTGPMKDTPECTMNKDEKEDKKKAEEKEATEPTQVNTNILGIEMASSFLTPEDIGDLSAEESAKLDQLF